MIQNVFATVGAYLVSVIIVTVFALLGLVDAKMAVGVGFLWPYLVVRAIYRSIRHTLKETRK